MFSVNQSHVGINSLVWITIIRLKGKTICLQNDNSTISDDYGQFLHHNPPKCVLNVGFCMKKCIETCPIKRRWKRTGSISRVNVYYLFKFSISFFNTWYKRSGMWYIETCPTRYSHEDHVWRSFLPLSYSYNQWHF